MGAENKLRPATETTETKVFQHHCRYLQVDEILDNASSILSAESLIIQEQGVFLFHLLNAPPIIWEGIMK